MPCPGTSTDEVRALRTHGIYTDDDKSRLRCLHQTRKSNRSARNASANRWVTRRMSYCSPPEEAPTLPALTYRWIAEKPLRKRGCFFVTLSCFLQAGN